MSHMSKKSRLILISFSNDNFLPDNMAKPSTIIATDNTAHSSKELVTLVNGFRGYGQS